MDKEPLTPVEKTCGACFLIAVSIAASIWAYLFITSI
jgi:hypothetical protein